MLHLVESGQAGTYNAVGPAAPCSWQGLLDACQQVTGSDATFTWVDEAFLLAEKVTPWSDLPLWVTEEDKAIHRVNIRRALGAGLTHHAVADTVRDLLAWDAARPADGKKSGFPPGISAEREAELLQAWRARK
jgi:2'-hydroxyisoflavone reductase